uniref:Uncharacterized protein n=1 Tax=Amphimedon queenslandica TaxID=400682 RepID=A0A1X7T5Y1_AMPQE
MAPKSPPILLHFQIHIDALMLCRKFEVFPQVHVLVHVSTMHIKYCSSLSIITVPLLLPIETQLQHCP